METVKKCDECGLTLTTNLEKKHGLCYECYSEMFATPDYHSHNTDDEGFYLKSKMAFIKKNIVAHQPKAYRIDESKIETFEDLKALLVLISENMIIFESAKGIEKVKHLLKEIR